MQGRAGRAMGREGNEERTPGHWGERESSQSVGGAGQSRLSEGNIKNHNNYVNTDSQTLDWAESELRLSLYGKTEKVKSAEVALD